VSLTSRIIAVLTLVVLSLSVAEVAYASTWTISLHTGSKSEAQSLTLQPPSGVTSACVTPVSKKEVTVTWGSVSHASEFEVWQSFKGGTYTAVTTLTGTSWTSSTLTSGTYSYEVETEVGTNWVSSKSSPSATRTINTSPGCQ
jgi:hypothetical protein